MKNLTAKLRDPLSQKPGCRTKCSYKTAKQYKLVKHVKQMEFSTVYRKLDTFDSEDCDCITPISRSMLDSDCRFSAAFRTFSGAGGAAIYTDLYLLNSITDATMAFCI